MKSIHLIIIFISFLFLSNISLSNNSNYPSEDLDHKEIIDLFLNEKFEDLNKILQKYHDLYQTDFKYEEVLYTLYTFFRSVPEEKEKTFEKWIDYSHDVYFPYLARGFYYIELAWNERGTDWAKNTSDKQFKGMRYYLEFAVNDAIKCLEKDKKLLLPYHILLTNSMAFGDQYQLDSLIKSALKYNPYTYTIRDTYLYTIEPKWGGSIRKMKKFIKKSQKYAKKNPKLKELRILVPKVLGDQYRFNKDYKNAIIEYKKAFKIGNYKLIYFKIAECYYFLDDYDNALQNVNKAIELDYENFDYLKLRVKINSYIDNIETIFEDIQTMKRINQYHDFTKLLRRIADNIVYLASKSYDNKDYLLANDYLNSAMKLDKNFYEIYYYKALILIDQKSFDKAEPLLLKSIELNPKHYNSYIYLDWVYVQSRDWDTIIYYWTKYLNLVPDNDKAYLERGGAYYHKKDFKSAMRDAKKSADLGNKEAKKRYNMLKNRVSE